jgi:formate hydrogenlyase subunit 4
LISFLYNNLIKINESALLISVISIYYEFKSIQFNSIYNTVSFLITVYVLIFNLAFFHYCFKSLNKLDLDSIEKEYTMEKFDELTSDVIYL